MSSGGYERHRPPRNQPHRRGGELTLVAQVSVHTSSDTATLTDAERATLTATGVTAAVAAFTAALGDVAEHAWFEVVGRDSDRVQLFIDERVAMTDDEVHDLAWRTAASVICDNRATVRVNASL
ncbi:hypothetical protein [Cryobacterium ruanii]|uniref:Uncharacterized protein n=1 Tax=Cryobacterium ruanii TaxID=1259197 RepID=A0A4R9AR21_9MICO|nr:hypothetical protein [Cryobacterium ruanii]TFD67975.1 hypothetical protein E3T47_05120 [Cryobacterium ruanii]